MRKERMTLEGLDDSDDAIMASDSKVVPLGDIVGEDHSRPLADPGKDGEKDASLQRLGLIDDDEGVM